MRTGPGRYDVSPWSGLTRSTHRSEWVRLEVGDRGVVVLLAQLLDGAFVPHAPFERRRGRRDFDLGIQRLGHRDADLPTRRRRCRAGSRPGSPRNHTLPESSAAAVTPTSSGIDDVPGRGEHDVIELQVGRAAIAELDHRVLTGERDHLRRRAIQQRRLATALEGCAARSPPPARAASGPCPPPRGPRRLPPSTYCAVSSTAWSDRPTTEDVLIGAASELGRHGSGDCRVSRDRRRPRRIVAPVGDQHRTGAVAQPVRVDHDVVADRSRSTSTVSPKPTSSWFGPIRSGSATRRRGLDDADTAESGAERRDRRRQSAGRPADDDEVVELVGGRAVR